MYMSVLVIGDNLNDIDNIDKLLSNFEFSLSRAQVKHLDIESINVYNLFSINAITDETGWYDRDVSDVQSVKKWNSFVTNKVNVNKYKDFVIVDCYYL